MKKLLIITLISLAFIGCNKDTSEPIPVPDTPEVNYLPIHVSASVEIDPLSGKLEELLTQLGYTSIDSLIGLDSLDFDTTVTDTQQLIGISRDSLFLYYHDSEMTTRAASLLSSPEIPISFDTTLLKDEFETSELNFKSVAITPEPSNVTFNGDTLNLIVTQRITINFEQRFEFSGAVVVTPYSFSGRQITSTVSTLFEEVVPPESWPAIQ